MHQRLEMKNTSMRRSWRKLELNQHKENWQKDYLSEEIVEKQLSEETAELESAVEWQVKATEEEDNMGDQVDLPFDQHEECNRAVCKGANQ
jgi:hypothetical protein